MTESDRSLRQCIKQQVQKVGAMNVVALITSCENAGVAGPAGVVIGSPCELRSVMPLIGEPIFRS